MARIGVKGLVATDTTTVGHAEIPSIPVLDWLFSQIQNAINGQLDSTNLAAKGIVAGNIADHTLTATQVVAASLTPTEMADTVGQTYSGSYTGDGTTVSRAINIGFTPRYVLVVRTDATFISFEAMGNGATTTYWYRAANGTQASSDANWQGVTTNGFKLGTNAAGTANVNLVVYQIVAWK